AGAWAVAGAETSIDAQTIRASLMLHCALIYRALHTSATTRFSTSRRSTCEECADDRAEVRAHEDVDRADGPFADDHPKQAFPEIYLQRAADVADRVGGGQREETPGDDDGQLASEKQGAQPSDLPRIPAFEEAVEPHGL